MKIQLHCYRISEAGTYLMPMDFIKFSCFRAVCHSSLLERNFSFSLQVFNPLEREKGQYLFYIRAKSILKQVDISHLNRFHDMMNDQRNQL